MKYVSKCFALTQSKLTDVTLMKKRYLPNDIVINTIPNSRNNFISTNQPKIQQYNPLVKSYWIKIENSHTLHSWTMQWIKTVSHWTQIYTYHYTYDIQADSAKLFWLSFLHILNIK